jgi:hypothetical protein
MPCKRSFAICATQPAIAVASRPRPSFVSKALPIFTTQRFAWGMISRLLMKFYINDINQQHVAALVMWCELLHIGAIKLQKEAFAHINKRPSFFVMAFLIAS